jgi:flagellar protein FliS
MSAFPSTANAAAANAYLKTRVLSATAEELRLMLLDGAIKFARQGREGFITRNYELSYSGMSQARDIVMELFNSIKDEPNPSLAAQIRGVYQFIYMQLVEGSHEKDLKKIDTAIDLLGYERETWILLMDKLSLEKGPAPSQPRVPVSA